MIYSLDKRSITGLQYMIFTHGYGLKTLYFGLSLKHDDYVGLFSNNIGKQKKPAVAQGYRSRSLNNFNITI